MTRAIQSGANVTIDERTCCRCGKHIGNGWTFAFKSRGRPLDYGDAAQVAEITKCFPCALRHRPMLKRSLTAAIVVGTALTMLNQGDALLSGHWENTLLWKIPLTYCVPLIVATYGALSNSRK